MNKFKRIEQILDCYIQGAYSLGLCLDCAIIEALDYYLMVCIEEKKNV